MNRYSEYIKKSFETDFTLIKTFKKTEESHIELFEHNDSKKRIVKISSLNRNDHVLRNLRLIKSDYLPVIYDVCSDDSEVIILESYIPGITLSDLLSSSPVDEKTAIKYTLDICSALSELHSHRIIHRDIKPSNIIIDESGRAVLIDFSSARELSTFAQTDTKNLGTPGYAAPEQYGVFQSLPATDIYALGILFNEMLTGISPIVKTVDGKLGKIVKKCINSQISDRYQSVDPLVKDIKSYLRFHKSKKTKKR